MDLRTKRKELQKFLEKNGCGVSIDFKHGDILIPDGGLWSIEAKKVKRHKIVGYKKLSNGSMQVLFSKKRIVKDVDYEVCIWISELRDTINYFKKLEKLLNKMGYDTKRGG